jgi:probable rRNA maturation factor
MGSVLTVEVNNLYPSLRFSLDSIDLFFNKIFDLHHHDCSGSLSVAFLDRTLHSQIHGNFLKDFRPTDVITFPADPLEKMAGEICVSVDQAIEEARNRKVEFSHELSLYLIHGWLHLVGFDDKEDDDRKIMRREEKKTLELVEDLRLWPNFLLAPSAEGE